MADYQDSKGWLENAFNTVMGLRKLPQNIGLDAARNLLGLGAGGLLRDPGKYTSSALENIGQSAKATIDPVTSAIQRARQSALQSLDAEPMEGSGTTPTAGGALPIDYRAPDAGSSAPVFSPAPSRRTPGPALAAAPSVPTPNMDLPPTEEVDAFPPYRAPMPNVAPPASSVVPAQPRQSYADMFKEILAQKQAKLEAPLSEDQKRALQLQFFLGMMSNSSKPGARIFGAMGDAGRTTLAAQQGMQKENLSRAEKERANQLETAYKMLDIRHKDESDQRLDRREATEAEYRKAQEKRFETLDKRDQRRLDIEEEKLKQSGNDVIGRELLENGNIGLVTKRGMIDSGFKGKKASEKNSQIDFYSWLMKNPGAQNLFLREKGPQPMNDKDAMTIATKMMESTPPNPGETPIQQLQRLSAGIVNASAASRNPQSPPDTKPDPAPNKGRVWIDDTTKERFKSDGKTWVKVK